MKTERVTKEDIFKYMMSVSDYLCRYYGLKFKEDVSIDEFLSFFDGKMSTTSEDHKIAGIIEDVICRMHGLHYKINVIEKEDHCLFYKVYIEDGCIEPGESFKGTVCINGEDIKIIGKRYSDFVIFKFPVMGDVVYKSDLCSEGLYITDGEYTLDNSFDQYKNNDGKEVILFNSFIAKEIVSDKNEITRGMYSYQTDIYKRWHKKDTLTDPSILD